MIVEIKGKNYETGKLVLIHAMRALDNEDRKQAGTLTRKGEIDEMIDIVVESLINGTSKTPYEDITLEQKEELKKLLLCHKGLMDIVQIFTTLAAEMNEGAKDEEGKPKA